MSPLRLPVAAMLAIALLVVLPGRAPAQTKEGEAAPDFGACPASHEKWIKERFESGLLSGYAGEPTVWPPQKYTYRDPFPLKIGVRPSFSRRWV